MDMKIRAAASVLLAAALAAASPVAALADPGPGETMIMVSAPDDSTSASTTVTASSPTISSTTVATGGTTASTTVSGSGTVEISPTTATASQSGAYVATSGTTTTASAPSTTLTTTGTVITASVPQTSVTVGTAGDVITPDTSGVATGSGTASVDRNATLSGSGLSPSQTTLSTSLTNDASPATVLGTDVERADQGASASAGANEPVSRSSLTAAARANLLLCLLAEASIDPTRAALSTLCADGPSGADGAIQVDAANDITGVAIGSDAALRAAVCLLGLVTSPAPASVATSELARASISTLCGSGPSTATAKDATQVTQDRTGTDVSIAPLVALASCLLASGTVGEPTIVQVSTLCGSATGGTPSTVDIASPTQLSDATSGTTLAAQPIASAAICILVDALARLPTSPGDAVATADLSTACGTPAAATPSTLSGETPVAGNGQGGTSADIAPSVNAAICLLANAELALGGSSLQVVDACAATAAIPPTSPSTIGPANVEIGVNAGGGTPASEAVAGSEAASLTQVTEASSGIPGAEALAALPSTSTTALAGIGLVLAAAIAMIARTRPRR